MEGYPDIRIVAVPYDSGHPGLRMGAGPEHLLDNGLGEGLRSEGRGQGVTTVRHEREPTAEVATAFELHGLVSNRVRRGLAADGFPRRPRPRWCPPATATPPLLARSRAPTAKAWASSGSTPTGSSTRRRPPRPASSTGWALSSPWGTAGRR